MRTFLIQNVDKIVRTNDFSDLKEDQLLVTSIFRTIQGEGILAGYPAVFLRLSGCNFGNKDPNLSCQWCDTDFAFDKGQIYSFLELEDKFLELPNYNEKDVLVITGGEPTLQHNLIKFIEFISPYFRKVQIETNGTQASFFQHSKKLIDQYGLMVVISPKANYSVNRYPQLSSTVLESAHSLKFVVDSDEDSPHHIVPGWAIEQQNKYGYEIYVSPMAIYKRAYSGEISSIWDEGLIDKEATRKNYSYAARYAMKNNFLLSLQTHLFTALP
jgi:7-carboxy-7-deazaguanine synthase